MIFVIIRQYNEREGVLDEQYIASVYIAAGYNFAFAGDVIFRYSKIK